MKRHCIPSLVGPLQQKNISQIDTKLPAWCKVFCAMLRSVLFFAISLPCARTIVVSTTWCQTHTDSCKGQKHSLRTVDYSNSCPWREHYYQDYQDPLGPGDFDPLPVFVDWNMDGYTDVLEAGRSSKRQLISQALHLFFHAILTYYGVIILHIYIYIHIWLYVCV